MTEASGFPLITEVLIDKPTVPKDISKLNDSLRTLCLSHSILPKLYRLECLHNLEHVAIDIDLEKEQLLLLCRIPSLKRLHFPHFSAMIRFHSGVAPSNLYPLPAELSNLPDLEYLYIKRQFESNDLDFRLLTNLCLLNLSFYSISWEKLFSFRDALGTLPRLQHVSLALSHIDPRDHPLMYKPPPRHTFPSLQTLAIVPHQGIYLSPFLFVGNPRLLRRLVFYSSQSEFDPLFNKRIRECTSLTSLSLLRCSVESGLEFPLFIQDIPSLHHFTLFHREAAPRQDLDLTRSPSCVIPPIWHSLPNLRHLFILGVDISLPPGSFVNLCLSLPQLETLSLNVQGAYPLPEEIGHLPNLTHLNIHNLPPDPVFPKSMTSCRSLSHVPSQGKQFFYDNYISFPFLDRVINEEVMYCRAGSNQGETPRDAMRRSLPTYRLHFKEWKDRVMYEMENDIDPDQLPGAPHPFVPEEFLEFSWELDGRRFLFTALESGDTSVVLYCLKHCPLKYLDLNELLYIVVGKYLKAIPNLYPKWSEVKHTL